MAQDTPGSAHASQPNHYFHGTRAAWRVGDLIAPGRSPASGVAGRTTDWIYLTPALDEAIWEGELADGKGLGRVYIVEPMGSVGRVADAAGQKPPPHPAMSWCTREPVRVVGEVTTWQLYHGTRADLKPGDLIKPGHTPNHGDRARTTKYVYFTRTRDAATWGAELAVGEGPGRIYTVEPTGPVEDDPNLTNAKFRGNPSKSFRSRDPLRVTGEITDWQGHAPDVVAAMKASLQKLAASGIQALDD